MYKIELEAKTNTCLSIFYPLRSKKSLDKVNPQSPNKKQNRHLWSANFAPDYSATVLAAEMCTNSHEHSMYIRFLWL